MKGPLRTTLVDIGCNKGYFSATALNHLTHGHGDHLRKVHRIHLSRGVYGNGNGSCGVCNDCKQTFASLPKAGQRHVEVLCVEPSFVHYQSLMAVRNILYDPVAAPRTMAADRSVVSFHAHNAAVSNYTGSVRFPKGCASELCSLSGATEPGVVASETEEVAVTTVDLLLRMYDLPYVDILKIDTEGFDPAVLAGAFNSLLQHRIGALSFEYHHLWAHTRASLEQCNAYLDALGYTCFYDGKTLTKISGSCWDASYEMRWWSNIVCAPRGSPLEFELMRRTYLHELWKRQQ